MNNTINGRTPEEIKRGLKCCAYATCNGCPYAEDGCATNREMIDALEYIQQLENHIGELTENVAQLEAAQSKWISVNERLPEAYDDGSVDAVLVTDGSFIHMAYFSGGKWRFCESGEMKEKMFYSVTHWMLLPEPPRRTHEHVPVRKDG